MRFGRERFVLSWVPTRGRHAGKKHWADYFTSRRWLLGQVKRLIEQGARRIKYARYTKAQMVVVRS